MIIFSLLFQDIEIYFNTEDIPQVDEKIFQTLQLVFQSASLQLQLLLIGQHQDLPLVWFPDDVSSMDRR